MARQVIQLALNAHCSPFEPGAMPSPVCVFRTELFCRWNKLRVAGVLLTLIHGLRNHFDFEIVIRLDTKYRRDASM